LKSLTHLAPSVGSLRDVFYTGVSVQSPFMAYTVMLADDDPVLLEEAADALREAGFKVIEAADGQEAIQEALSRRVDLIVMDATMPEVDGLEACHCLKAMPKTQKIPVVLTISKRDPVARRLGERTHGSVRVLRKPFLSDELVSLARQLVKRKSLLL
jgi:CheY-like chemotaxis protein